MTSEILQLATVVGLTVGPAGAAWIGVKVSLNGTRERVKDIQRQVETQGDLLHTVDTRLSVIEDRSKRVRATDAD